MTEAELRVSPLHEIHQSEGGRLVAFAGWNMPVQYSGINDEHLAVRRSVGLFDVSHMGQLVVRGAEAHSFLHYVLPAQIDRLGIGALLYTAMCNERGGCIDDLIVYRMQDQEFLLVVNAGRAADDWQWIQKAATRFTGVELIDESAETAMLALQGPDAESALSGVAGASVANLSYYRFAVVNIEGQRVVISRNGYTGEDGFELMCSTASAAILWRALRSAGAVACGLGSRDTLRTEMGFCLYGHELNEHISPIEAGIGWTLDLDKKEEFIGKTALIEQRKANTYRRLRGITMIDKGIPRAGYALRNSAGECIGEISSGTQSPCLQKGIGLAFVERGKARVGERVFVDVRGKSLAAELNMPPFVESHVKKSKRTK
jgi:aminomethyltransferase